jgi:hypothetical protein
MKKQIITNKTTYGGMLVDKYFFIFNDGTEVQVPYKEWSFYKIGEEYPREKTPDSLLVEAMKEVLNEKPSIDWKEAHDMQQKLVVHYVLENEKLKDEIKLLKNSVKSVKNSFEYFQERFYKQRDLTERFKKRAMEAEEKLKLSEKVDKICKEIEAVYKERDYLEVNVKLRKELRMMEKLLELNMKDFHDIAEQRDWYYERYTHYKKTNAS